MSLIQVNYKRVSISKQGTRNASQATFFAKHTNDALHLVKLWNGLGSSGGFPVVSYFVTDVANIEQAPDGCEFDVVHGVLVGKVKA